MNWKLSKKCGLISVVVLTLIVTICVVTPLVVISRSSKTTVSRINDTTTVATTRTTTSITTSTATRTTTTTKTTSTTSTVTTSTATSSTISSTTSQTTTTERPFILLTNPGDTIVGIYNTRAGESVNGVDGVYPAAENSLNAIDNDFTTKYLNFGGPTCTGCTSTTEGINTGFIVIPAISGATVARAIIFVTANDFAARDPLEVTLEGSTASDSSSLSQGSSWTLLYRGPSGINTRVDPGRMVYGDPQSFSNTTPYRSYRLLVTSRRGAADSVQYAECHILGYVAT